MGEKDMQQLKIVKHFVTNNFDNIKIIECKTVREKNGTALSSRNKLLSIKGNYISSRVYKLIYNSKKKIINNKIKLSTIKKQIYKIGVSKIDYVQILDINKIVKPYIRTNKYKIFVAYYIDSVRLIDNI
jgi:pantoate--beta-alanine ligase